MKYRIIEKTARSGIKWYYVQVKEKDPLFGLILPFIKYWQTDNYYINLHDAEEAILNMKSKEIIKTVIIEPKIDLE